MANPNDKLLKLQVYADKLKQRLNGKLDPEMRKVVEIDLRKTETKIAKLR